MSAGLEREQEIFVAALELPAEVREAYLDEACADDAALAQRLRRLVAAHERAEQSSSQVQPPPPEDDIQQVGPYRILEQIGEGGMGVVYLAEQTAPMRRRVALKIIKLGMDTREVIARFESERQALAMMNHPGIARILDAGATERGRPYFVMEYVRGIPITDYCDQMQVDLESRLRLLGEVCHAVQHAHHKGVIHRDLKPSNILITTEQGEPAPKVIDFGVAKATDHRLSDATVHTRLGYMIGTPEYMSPEQAELTPLSVDTRSDVYSLGAVLYELLVGVRPFEFDAATSQLDIRQTVQSAEPDPPSTRLAKLSSAESEEIARLRRSTPAALRRLLGGELGWVTARALAKDPNRRYQSAQALAEDIDRYLNARPVTAGPESLGYRLGKFVRRNRAAVASVAIVLVALVGGLALASLGFIEARQERDLAQQARDESEAVTAFLERMLAAADPAEKGRDVTVLEILDDASGRVGEEFSDRPLLEARLRGTIGETYRELGVLDPSAQHLERQLAIYEARLDADDPVRIAAQHQLAWIYAEQGRLNEAAALYEKTLADRRRVLGEEDRETLRTMNNLGLLYADQDRFDEAERIMEDVLETRERTLGLRHPDTLVAMNNLALLYGKQGRHEQSAALHIKEYELTREVLGEEHPDTLISLSNVAYSYDILDRAEESERAYREGLVLSERVVGPDHPTTLMMQNNLGAVLARAGRLEESEQHLRQALAGRQRVLGQSHHATLLTSASLGTNLLKQGRAPEAEPYLRQAAERGADSLPPDSIRLARFRAQYGHCLLALERFDEAEPLLFSAERSLAAASEGGVTAVDETLAQARGDLAALEERRQPLP